MIHTVVAGLDCQINDLQNYSDSIKDCDLVKTLTFNITKWQPIPQDLINKTRSINAINVTYQSLETIDDKGFCAWPKLTSINAGKNNITKLLPDLLADCRVLNSLLLSKNSISQIDEDAFQQLPFLTDLDLSSNQIEVLSDDVFKSLISLKTLRLNNNKIQAISDDYFQYISKLETLDLSYNSIETIEQGSFWNLKKLFILDVSYNPDLKTIDLSEMDRLQYVNIDGASLEQLNIPENVVKITANFNKITTLALAENGILEELYLRNNSLETIKELSAAGELTALDISYNNIKNIDFSYLMSTQIQRLVVLGNPIRKFNVSTLLSLPYLQTVEISTDSLDKETLSALDDGTNLLYNSVRVPNGSQQRRNVVEITESTYAPSTELSKIRTTTVNSNSNVIASKSVINIRSTPIAPDTTTFKPETKNGNDTKDEIIRTLLNRIQKLELNQGSSSEIHRQTEQNVSDLRILIVCTIIAFSMFVSIQIGLFVYENYEKWNIQFPINVNVPNVIASSPNGMTNNRRNRNDDGSCDPMIEDVF